MRSSTARSTGFGSASPLQGEGWCVIRYVYILECIAEPSRHYVGLTADLRARLRKHNAGEMPHTSKFMPWRVKSYLAFSDQDRAVAFERYLKTASGRAFAKKRL